MPFFTSAVYLVQAAYAHVSRSSPSAPHVYAGSMLGFTCTCGWTGDVPNNLLVSMAGAANSLRAEHLHDAAPGHRRLYLDLCILARDVLDHSGAELDRKEGPFEAIPLVVRSRYQRGDVTDPGVDRSWSSSSEAPPIGLESKCSGREGL
jgi:hypothetical protein